MCIRDRMTVDIEMNYDSFSGRTPEEFAELVHDDVINALWEMRNDEVKGLFTDVKTVRTLEDAQF